ncbi:MAG: hypothetical protein RIS50_377, partial [Bacteroidota bacterium]
FFYSKPEVTNSPYNEAPGMRAALFVNIEKYFNEDYTYLIHGAFSSRNKENNYVAGASISLPILWKFDQDRRLYLGCYLRLTTVVFIGLRFFFLYSFLAIACSYHLIEVGNVYGFVAIPARAFEALIVEKTQVSELFG